MRRSTQPSAARRLGATATTVVIAMILATMPGVGGAGAAPPVGPGVAARSLPAAPSDFPSTLVNFYQAEHDTALALSPKAPIEPVTAFANQLRRLGPRSLALLYGHMSRIPDWRQVPTELEAVAAEVTAPDSSEPSSGAQPASSGGPGTIFQDTPCPSGASNPSNLAVFLVQLVSDALSGNYNAFVAQGNVTALGNANIPALYIAVAFGTLLTASSIIHDGLVYAQNLAENCSIHNLDGDLTLADASAWGADGLLGTSAATSLSQLQTSQTGNTSALAGVQSGLATAFSSLDQTDQTIGTSTSSLSSQAGADSQGTMATIGTLQSALESDMQTLLTQGTATHTALAQAATDAAGLKTLLTNAVGQVTAAIDATSSTVASSINSSFSAPLQGISAQLAADVEQGLAVWSSASPPPVPNDVAAMQLVSPAFLPIERTVVENDLTDASNAGLVTPAGLTEANGDISNGDSALANNEYVSAYGNYAAAYAIVRSGVS